MVVNPTHSLTQNPHAANCLEPHRSYEESQFFSNDGCSPPQIHSEQMYTLKGKSITKKGSITKKKKIIKTKVLYMFKLKYESIIFLKAFRKSKTIRIFSNCGPKCLPA